MNFDKTKILSTPKIDAAAIRWLWANDWYDWILSGVCEYQGKKYYGWCFNESEKRTRLFAVIDLPPEEWAKEIERHELFVEKVGDHFDFREDGAGRKCTGVKPEKSWEEYYDRYPPHQDKDYSQYPVVGWFED